MKKNIFKLSKVVIIYIFIFLIFFSSSIVEAEKYNMSYLFFGSTEKYTQTVINTNGSVNTVSPNYLGFRSNGTLYECVDETFVNKMHEINIKVVPFLSNHWDRELGREALRNKELLAQEIVDVIIKYNLDGINIDIENLTEVDRDNFTDFIRLLYDGLPEDKELSIAVAANPTGTTRGWPGSYDYKELAKYSDYLMLMTYDESYYGSSPGAVASLDYVEKSIQYALTEVPADKIVLGIPFYGRYWKYGEKGGRGIPNYQVEDLVNQFNGKYYFDDKSKSAYATFTIPYGSSSEVYYRTLSPGKYTIWYENDESLKLKLRLVEEYNLLGTGSWSLTEISDEVWDYYSSWLNGEHYFLDVENHWAEFDVLSMLEKNWMVGTSDEYFSPNQSLTRAQATVVLIRALGLDNNIIQEEVSTFDDIGTRYWAKNEIEIAYQYGIIEGKAPGIFAPNDSITRAEIAKMLSRISNDKDKVIISNTNVSPFEDVNINHWAYDDIIRAYNNNILMGYSDGNFHPTDYVTRAQMAAIMNRIE